MVVGIVSSNGSYNGVYKVLNLIRRHILNSISKARNILVKPNFVSTRVELSATPVEAVEALLDFITPINSEARIIIGEGSTLGSFENGLKNYGYLKLKDKFDIEFVDLNEDSYRYLKIYNSRLEKTIEIPVSKTVLDSDYRISICRAKTHDTVIVTLTVKNIVMGSVQSPYKSTVHQGYLAINMSIADLYKYMPIHLAIIDGYIGMEGNGPIFGDPVKWGVAIAGDNAIEVDSITASLMGFNVEDIGYLYFLWNKNVDLSRINIIGEDLNKFKRKFKPHTTYLKQLNWKKEYDQYRKSVY